jgi:hypothetical protein
MDCCQGDSLFRGQSTRAHDRYGVRSGWLSRLVTAQMEWLAVIVMLGGTPVASGAEAAARVAASPESPNQEAVAWLDHFALEQVLFRDQDIAQIRRKMAKAPPERAQQWLGETAELRRNLESPGWQETRKWLSRFLKVQAIYTDKELDEFHKKVMAATPAELGKMMREIEERRSTLSNKANAAARRRQQMMEVNNGFKQEQFAQRQAVRRAAGQAANFGTTKSTKVNGKPSYAKRFASRAPLISALGVARWAVYRSIWSRW